MLEGNNKQLFYLLEKYDSKVTELQEDIDIKDLKIRYELFIYQPMWKESTNLSWTDEAR